MNQNWYNKQVEKKNIPVNDNILESKMSEIHSSIGEHMDDHINEYKQIGGAESLMGHADTAAKNIAKKHNIADHHAKKFVNDYIDSRLRESIDSIKNMILENINYDITESVSYDSKKYYEMSEGKKPSGNGNWSFSTIRPTRYDSSNKDHMENTFSQTGNFSDVVRNAVKHFKSKGHTGEIHLLS
jgi:protoheme ferro-lyase